MTEILFSIRLSSARSLLSFFSCTTNFSAVSIYVQPGSQSSIKFQTVYTHFKKLGYVHGALVAVCTISGTPYAMLPLQNGDDFKTVQEALRHATAAFTLDIYGHVSQSIKTDSADRMQGHITAAKISKGQNPG